MRNRLFYHIVWTTKSRAPLIDAETAVFLCRSLRGLAKQHRASLLEIGMVSTHVHLLLHAVPLTKIPEMVGRMKAVTTRIAQTETIGPLSWGEGYDVETVGPQDEMRLRQHLRAQPFRHPDEAIGGWNGDEFALGETRPG